MSDSGELLLASEGELKQRGADSGGCAIAYVGSVIPDDPAYRTSAFARSGNLAQASLLEALRSLHREPSLILSVRPIPSAHRGGRLWESSAKATLDNGLGVRLFGFPNIVPLKALWVGFSTLWQLLRWSWTERKRRRAIVAFNLSVPPGLFTLLAARLSGSLAIGWINDVNVPGQTVPRSLWHRLDFWLQGGVLPRCDGLAVVSDAIGQDFAPHVPTVRIDGGIRRDWVDRANAPRDEDGRFVVVATGLLDEVNGIHLIAQSLSYLEGLDWRLVIAGAGPLERQIRAIGERDGRLEYRGFIPHEEVLQLYQSADVLVSMRPTGALNTRYFFPSKLMEYLASGTPVISTRTGHVEAEYSDFVYLLRDETPAGLARLLQRVREDPPEVRRDYGRRARDYMARNKTWSAQATGLLALIDRLAGPNPDRRETAAPR